MAVRWSTDPAITFEALQTGDGRIFLDGAFTWDLAGGPLPFRWDREDDGMHAGAVLVGTIDVLERRPGGVIYAEGDIDDTSPDGLAYLAMLTARGSHGVSVDLDDWASEVVWNGEGADEGGLLMFSAAGRGAPAAGGQRGALAAAAGDGDVDGEVVFQMSSDEMIERYSRARIRGATSVDLPAFDQARVRLAAAVADPAGTGDPAELAAATGDAVGAAVVDEDPAEHVFVPGGDDPELCAACVEEDAEANCTRTCGLPEEGHMEPADEGDSDVPPEFSAGAAPAAPLAAWFEMTEPELGDDLLVEQPGGGWAVPLTISDDGTQVFGHLARWGSCHTGFPGECVSPPASALSYALFRVGEVLCAGGERVATGPLTMGCDHAAVPQTLAGARDHYAHTGLAWADVTVVDGQFGPWCAGAVRPGLSDEQLRSLRASSLSGDWRRPQGSHGLELIGVLAVNHPGFPIVRGMVAAAAPAAPTVEMDGTDVVALVASGLVQRCADCAGLAADVDRLGVDRGQARLARAVARLVTEAIAPQLAKLDDVELRTRPLADAARAAVLERIAASSRH